MLDTFKLLIRIFRIMYRRKSLSLSISANFKFSSSFKVIKNNSLKKSNL